MGVWPLLKPQDFQPLPHISLTPISVCLSTHGLLGPGEESG